MFDCLVCFYFRPPKAPVAIVHNEIDFSHEMGIMMEENLRKIREENLKKMAARRKLRREERKKQLEQRAGELSDSEQRELDSIYAETYPPGLNRRIRYLLQAKR